MASFCVRLAETALTWGRAVAPIAEMVARTLSATIKKKIRTGLPPTRLTQSERREARGLSFNVHADCPPRPIRVCRGCGASIVRGKHYCMACGLESSAERMPEVARAGRVPSHNAEAQARRAETQRLHAKALKNWRLSDLPDWLTEQVYREKIRSCPAFS